MGVRNVYGINTYDGYVGDDGNGNYQGETGPVKGKNSSGGKKQAKNDDKGKQIDNESIRGLNPFALAKLGKAVPIKNSYSKEEISIVISTALSFGIEFVGAAELLAGWVGTSLSSILPKSETFVAYGISGEGYTANFLAGLFKNTGDDAVKTLYRGMTGSEVKNGALFLTDNPGYAATYVKNGLTVAEFHIPRYAYYFMKTEGLLSEISGVHSGSAIKGTEVMISNPYLKELVLKTIVK